MPKRILTPAKESYRYDSTDDDRNRELAALREWCAAAQAWAPLTEDPAATRAAAARALATHGAGSVES